MFDMTIQDVLNRMVEQPQSPFIERLCTKIVSEMKKLKIKKDPELEKHLTKLLYEWPYPIECKIDPLLEKPSSQEEEKNIAV